MTREWYKVLVVALVLVTRVTLEEVEERWPPEDTQGAEGDSRADGEDRDDQAVYYRNDHLMDSESRRDLVSKEALEKNNGDGESADEVIEGSNDDDEVEDLSYDSDIEKIYTKTNLEDVDTGKQSRHDKVMFEPQARRAQFRRQQHWDDKPGCLIVHRGREKPTQKELARDTRELVTREPTIYYDMKRAKRRMLAFPRRGGEDRSSWGAKIIEALETALNTAAKTIYSMDEKESLTGQYKDPDRITIKNRGPTERTEPKRNTLLTDHRETLTVTEHEESVGSTSENSRSGNTRTTYPTREKLTSPLNDISSTAANSSQKHHKEVIDPHPKREKAYNTWSRFRDSDISDDSSEEQEGRMDVMPYSDETRKNVKLQRGRGKSSSSSESDERPFNAPKPLIKGKATKGKLMRTTTTATLHRTQVYTSMDNEDSLSDDSDETTASAEALDSSDQKSAEKTTKRVKNFYPLKYNSHKFGSESQSNEDDDGKSPEEADAKIPEEADGKGPEKAGSKSSEETDELSSSTTSPAPFPSTSVVYHTTEKSTEINQESSQQESSEESKSLSKESDERSSEEIEIDFNQIGHKSDEESALISKIKYTQKESSDQRSTTVSLEVVQLPHHHDIMNNEMFHSSTHMTHELRHSSTHKNHDMHHSSTHKNHEMHHSSTHKNHEMHHSSTHKHHLVLNTSQEAEPISGRRDYEEFYPGVGKVPLKVTPGQGLISEPEFTAPVPVAGMEELFILPEASSTMRRHWESFYKSVSRSTRPTVSPQVASVPLLLLLQYLFVI